MVHLRIVSPPERAEPTLRLLRTSKAVSNLVHLPGAVHKPAGDLILCDVTSEETSLVVADLRELGVAEAGSIALEPIDSQVSAAGVATERRASASQAVIWEEVEARTEEMAALSAVYLVFMVLAMLIGAVGIVERTSILIVAAMIVGPDFGVIAAAYVALVERRGSLALRSLASLVAGFATGIVVSGLVSLGLERLGVFPGRLVESAHRLPPAVASVVGPPSELSFLVAFLAGIVGALSLSTAKSGAIIGVLVSVTTIPAAANVALAGAYGDSGVALGSLEQLGANVVTLFLAGSLTLGVQRLLYRYRRAHEAEDPARASAGLPARRP